MPRLVIAHFVNVPVVICDRLTNNDISLFCSCIFQLHLALLVNDGDLQRKNLCAFS